MMAVAILTKNRNIASLSDRHHPILSILANKTTNIIKLGIEHVLANILRSRYVAIATQPVHRLQIPNSAQLGGATRQNVSRLAAIGRG